MFYLLDGYNILFFLDKSKNRNDLIAFLQKKFQKLSLKGLLVFDGAHREGEESGRTYTNPLEVIYTPKKQSADTYILEKIEGTKNRKEIILVTNDQGLTRQARAMRADVLTISQFFTWIEKKNESCSEIKLQKDTPQNKERLLRIFLQSSKDTEE